MQIGAIFMFELLKEKKFKKEIVNLDFDIVNQVFIIGFSNYRYKKSGSGSIWNLNEDLSLNNCLSEDDSVLTCIGVGTNATNTNDSTDKGDFRCIAGGYFDRNNKSIPLMKIFLSTNKDSNTIFTPSTGNTDFREISFIRIFNDHTYNIVFFNRIGQILQDNKLVPLSEYLPLQRNYISAISDLREFSTSDTSLPEILVSTKCGTIQGFRGGKQCLYREYLPYKRDIFWTKKNDTNQIITRKYKGDYYTLLINGPSSHFMYRGQSSLIMLKNFEILWTLDKVGDFGTIADLDNDGEDEIACFGIKKNSLSFIRLKYFQTYSILKNIYTNKPVVVWQHLIHEGLAYYPFRKIFSQDIDKDGKLELITVTEHTIRIFKFKD